MSVDPALVGARVLAVLEAGRAVARERALARAAATARAVRRAYDDDKLRGGGDYGRIKRIARQVKQAGHDVGTRQVRRILRSLLRPRRSEMAALPTADGSRL